MGAGFVLEDGDGTEVTITENKEIKFVEGVGIDIDWTDVSPGSDADPYDLTFSVDLEGTELKSTGEGGGTKFLREDGDGTCSWQTISAAGTLDQSYDSGGAGAGAIITVDNQPVQLSGSNGVNATTFVVTGSSSMMGGAVTSGVVFDITAPDITTGAALAVEDDSSSTGTRNSVNIMQAQAAATGTTALRVQADSNGAVPGLLIDRNFTGTTNIGNFTTDPSGLLIDYDVTGIVASGQTAVLDGISINWNQEAPTMVGTVNSTGMDVRMTGGTSGTQSMKGMAIVLAGADTNTGIDITVPNDGSHFLARSPDNLLDQFKISVGASGATTLSTNDADASIGNLILDADGKIIIEAIAGDESVFNEGGLDVDFRVESNNKEHAFFINGGTDQVLILSGGGGTSSNESNYADTNFFVSGSGMSKGTSVKGTAVFGGDMVVSGALHTVRIQSEEGASGYIDLMPAAIEIGATNNVLIQSNSAPGIDANFFVSGSISAVGTTERGASVFGGDTYTSGSMHSGGARFVNVKEIPSSSPYNVLDGDYYLSIPTSGLTATINLPAANNNVGRILIIADGEGNANSRNITIDPNASEDIGGSSTKVMSTAGEIITIICVGGGWSVVSTNQ